MLSINSVKNTTQSCIDKHMLHHTAKGVQKSFSNLEVSALTTSTPLRLLVVDVALFLCTDGLQAKTLTHPPDPV